MIKESSFYRAVYNIDVDQLEREVDNFLEKNSQDEDISVDSLIKAFSEMKGKVDKPGLQLLPEKKKKSYTEDLKKKTFSTIKGNKEIASKDKFSKREVRALMTRHFLGLAVGFRNSEFDILVTLKVTISFVFLRRYANIK